MTFELNLNHERLIGFEETFEVCKCASMFGYSVKGIPGLRSRRYLETKLSSKFGLD